MIDDIINTLHENYPQINIYTENVEQGLKTPCFIVNLLNTLDNREIKDRYKLTHNVMIQYLPNSKKPKAECMSMMKNLLLALSDFGNYHASEISGNIVNKVLNIDLSYVEFVQGVLDAEEMGQVQLNVRN